jgi:iron complex transport system substrate-binding protein
MLRDIRYGLATLLTLLLAACGDRAPRQGPLVVIDDARDTVRLERPAERIVSLIPASTELLFAIGAGPQMVGRSRWCDWPAEAAAVTAVGDGIEPNLEAILAQRPDLVVLYLAGSNAAAADRLRAAGIPVVQLRTDLLESVIPHAFLLGTLTGRRPAADSLVRTFEAELAAATVSSHPGPDAPPRFSVLLLAWADPPIAIGAGSFLDELVTRAGGTNLFHDLPQPSAPVSLEAIADRDPDLILTTGDSLPRIVTRPEWRVVPAVRDRRFVRVHGTEFDRPGPRTPQAIRELREAFRQVDRPR